MLRDFPLGSIEPIVDCVTPALYVTASRTSLASFVLSLSGLRVREQRFWGEIADRELLLQTLFDCRLIRNKNTTKDRRANLSKLGSGFAVSFIKMSVAIMMLRNFTVWSCSGSTRTAGSTNLVGGWLVANGLRSALRRHSAWADHVEIWEPTGPSSCAAIDRPAVTGLEFADHAGR